MHAITRAELRNRGGYLVHHTYRADTMLMLWEDREGNLYTGDDNGTDDEALCVPVVDCDAWTEFINGLVM